MITKRSDWNSLHEIHHKKRHASIRCARIENFGNVRVVHHGQCLPLSFESGDDLASVHAGFDNLQSYLALYRFRLLGHVDHAETALANLPE